MENKSILGQYDEGHQLYSDFLNYFTNTLKGITSNNSIILQEISGRVKKRDSLEKKIKVKNRYNSISEVTDICGIRIITYFSDDVDRIAALLEKEFEVDQENSIDKRENDDPTKFGYVSLHYIISLKKNRFKLEEAKKFEGMKIEIQVRTILQHAWAEIEHDLGYKAIGDIPVSVRRSFSRLAGIIELADEEFVRIKETLNEYSNDVKSSIENKDSSKGILIDNVSLSAFLTSDKEYLNYINSLSDELHLSLDSNIESNGIKKYISLIVNLCSNLSIDTIDKLNEVFHMHKNSVKKAYGLDSSDGLSGIGITSPLLDILEVLDKNSNINVTEEMFIRDHRNMLSIFFEEQGMY